MKMGMAKVCGFLTMSVLPFILLVDSTVACVIIPTVDCNPPDVEDYKRLYCKNDIVIKGFYLDKWNEEGSINRFRLTQLIKGPMYKNKVIKINSEAKSFCDYNQEEVKVEEFIISAIMDNDHILCIESEPLYWMTNNQKDALEEISRFGCK